MKITIGDWRAVARESNKERHTHDRLDPEYFQDQLKTLATALEGGAALNGGCYSYTPRPRGQWEAQSWVCSDGGVHYGSLSDLMLRVVDRYKLDELDADEDWMLEQLIVPELLSQPELEGGQMRGDWG